MSNDPIADIIALAKTQVGYKEGPHNHTKYPPEVPGLEWAQNQPWCATFCSWLALKSGLGPYYPKTASVPVAKQWGISEHSYHEYPAVGALVIVGASEHIGLVIDYDADTITTIEGNTNNNGSANGDGVYKRTRRRRDPRTTGYVYPVIPNVVLRSADPNYKPPAKTVVTASGDKLTTAKGVVYTLTPGQRVKVL